MKSFPSLVGLWLIVGTRWPWGRADPAYLTKQRLALRKGITSIVEHFEGYLSRKGATASSN